MEFGTKKKSAGNLLALDARDIKKASLTPVLDLIFNYMSFSLPAFPSHLSSLSLPGNYRAPRSVIQVLIVSIFRSSARERSRNSAKCRLEIPPSKSDVFFLYFPIIMKSRVETYITTPCVHHHILLKTYQVQIISI